MPLPRPPLHVEVAPSTWDLLANLISIIATVGTAVAMFTATLLQVWQIIRTRRLTC